jgi:hypothetical protein
MPIAQVILTIALMLSPILIVVVLAFSKRRILPVFLLAYFGIYAILSCFGHWGTYSGYEREWHPLFLSRKLENNFAEEANMLGNFFLFASILDDLNGHRRQHWCSGINPKSPDEPYFIPDNVPCSR